MGDQGGERISGHGWLPTSRLYYEGKGVKDREENQRDSFDEEIEEDSEI